jgi:hypothetical protein
LVLASVQPVEEHERLVGRQLDRKLIAAGSHTQNDLPPTMHLQLSLRALDQVSGAASRAR